MAIKEYYKVEIPDGYRIFEKEFELAGVQHRKQDFFKLMKKGAIISFSLRPEPNNPRDPNAVQIRGSRKSFWGKVDRHIGYVPAQIASHVSDTKLLSLLKVRPKRIYVSDKGFIEFTLDILGPKNQFDQYKNV